MKSLVLAACLLLLCPPAKAFAQFPDEEALLKAGGDVADKIIYKARAVLATQQVLASKAVGFGGQPSSGCWALSVVVRFDKEAKEILEAIYQSCNEPATRLYAIAGLTIVDPDSKTRFTSEKLGSAAHQKVEYIDGCEGSTVSFGDAAKSLILYGSKGYIYDKLPSLYDTVDCTKQHSDTDK